MPGSMSHKLAVWPRTVAHSPVSDWAVMEEFFYGPCYDQLYLKITSKMLTIFSVINIDQIKNV